MAERQKGGRPKARLDTVVTDRGLAPSRERARALILAGQVAVDGQVVSKAGAPVAADARVELAIPDHPYVGRGGVKLAHALDVFSIDPTGRRALDVGASTGGFTDVLLQRGAASVIALDVGRGQLDHKLRSDPRVESLERTNVRHFELGERAPYDLVTADVSFISLKVVLPRLRALVRPGGRLLVLVKPQFELERRAAPKGVVRDPELRARAVREVREAAEALGLVALGESESALAGPKGNREVFLLFRRQPANP